MDCYNILGVTRTASQDDIKKAFRKLAMTHHPDKGGNAVEFQKINEAYETLSDPQRRAAHDNPQPHPQFSTDFGFGAGGININDIFSQMFGQKPPHQQHQPHPQQIYRTRLTIALIESYSGISKVIQLNTPHGMKVVTVDVPKGVQSGSQVRYDNVIDQATLIIEFIVLPDLRFDRNGDDLMSNVPISALDLIVGTKIEFKTLGSKTLEVVINPKTQPHQQIRIPGYGMPNQNGSNGDQILLFKVFIPDNIHQDIIDSIINHKSK